MSYFLENKIIKSFLQASEWKATVVIHILFNYSEQADKKESLSDIYMFNADSVHKNSTNNNL